MSCADKLIEVFGKDITPRQAKEIAEFYGGLFKTYEDNRGAYKKLATQEANRFNLKRLKDARAEMSDNVKMIKVVNHIFQEGFKTDGKFDIYQGLLSLMEGTTRKVKNKKVTVERVAKSNYKNLVDSFFNSLRDKKIFRHYAEGKYNDEIIDEVEARAFPNYTPNKTPEIVQIADEIVRLHNMEIKMQQNAGSTIEAHPGFSIHKNTDIEKALSYRKGYVDNMLQMVDLERSFNTKSVKHAQVYFNRMLDNLGDVRDGSKSFMGGKREIFFKQGQFKEYNKLYGYDTLQEGIVKASRNASEKAALTEIFGNNAIENIEKLMDFADRSGGRDVGLLKKGRRSMEDAMDLFAGVGNRTREGFWGNTFKNVQHAKTYNALRVLGNAGFAAMNDISSAVATLRSADGTNPFVGLARTLFNVMEAFPGDKKELGEMFEVGITDMSREIVETYSTGGVASGYGRTAVDVYMTLNLTKPITTLTRTTTVLMHSKSLTNTLNLDSTKLNNFQKLTIDEIGLDATDVKNIRKVIQDSDSKTVNPRDIRKFELKDFDSKGLDPEAYRQELANKISAYFNDAVTSGSPIMGAKEARLMGRHRPQDDPVRVVSELLTQFKGTLLKMAHVTAEGMRKSNDSGDLIGYNSVRGLSQLLLAAGAVNYGIETAKNAVKMKDFEFPDLTTVEGNAAFVKDFTQSMVNSGIPGVYMDVLLEMWTRDGRSRGVSPVIDQVDKIGKLITTGNITELEKNINFLQSMIPGQNLWFNPAVNNYILKEASFRTHGGL